MKLKSLTYTSLARLDLNGDDLHAIHRSALNLNALDGITGLLVFNGTHFLQIVEGAEPAIDDLMGRKAVRPPAGWDDTVSGNNGDDGTLRAPTSVDEPRTPNPGNTMSEQYGNR